MNCSVIVKKACQKAHKLIVETEKIAVFYICYVVPESLSANEIHDLIKIVRASTYQYMNYVYVRKLNIVFTKAPDVCFACFCNKII